VNEQQRAELRNIAEGRQGKQRRTLLPSPAPLAGAPAEELMGWLTVALGLGGDPVAQVMRYGRHDDARLVATLRSGLRVVFDRQAEMFSADVLVRRVVLATGAEVPPYQRGDAFTIAATLVRAADLVGEDDDRTEARDWALTFLHAATELLPREDMGSPAGRYAGLCRLRDWKHPEALPWMTVAERSAMLPATNGSTYVRVSDFAAHVRQMAGRSMDWGLLHSRMREIGWEHLGRLEQRQPHGSSKVKLTVFRLPPNWDDQGGEAWEPTS
jgi:hypothetical protein